MAAFLEVTARSVGGLFSLCFVRLWCLFVSHFGFEGGICLLIAPVPVHCFSVAFNHVIPGQSLGTKLLGRESHLTVRSHGV